MKNYNIESRIINGTRRYRCKLWDHHNDKSLNVYANSHQDLLKKLMHVGIRINRNVKSQINLNV